MTKKKNTAPVAPGKAAKAESGKSTGDKGTARVSRVEERRREKQQQQRRQQLLLIGAVIGVVAVLAAISLIVNSLPAEASIPAGAVERYSGIPVSFSAEGYPILGNPANPVRVREYSSFSCPHCRDLHEAVSATALERIKAGDVLYTFVPVARYGNPGGLEAGRAAMCVAQQNQTTFWAYYDTLFSWQGLYGNQAFAPNRLRAGVENLGLDVDLFNTCYSGSSVQSLLDEAEAEAVALDGFGGTPYVSVNGVELTDLSASGFNAAVDQALAAAGLQPGQNAGDVVVTDEAAPPVESVATDEAAATDEVVVTDEVVATDEAAATPEVTPGS